MNAANRISAPARRVPLKYLLHAAALCTFAGAGLIARAEPPVAAISTQTIAAASQPSMAQESRVKAAYLVKFTQYTSWPASTFESDTSPIVIGIIGPSPIAADLKQEARPITRPRPIEIRTIATPEEATHCHAVFFSRTDSYQEESWLVALKGKPVLTVGESDQTIKRGAIIHFVAEGKKVLFEVSRPAMERSNLKISTEMLRYAKTVRNALEASN